MMEAGRTGQVVSSAAEVYQQFFVPALFQEWAGKMVNTLGVQPGHRVLDVACGTGVFARAACERAGKRGCVAGLDINESMLAVARRLSGEIEWRHGRAEALPYADASFDRIGCQFGLMFFEDRPRALREMVRVLQPGGQLAVAVWDSIEHSPGFAAMVTLLNRMFGHEVADTLCAPFQLGDLPYLCGIFEEAGLINAAVDTVTGCAHFPSVREWAFVSIKGWTLAETLDDDQLDMLCQEAEVAFAQFVLPDGSVQFDSPAHITTVTKH